MARAGTRWFGTTEVCWTNVWKPLLCLDPILDTGDAKVDQTWPLTSICGARRTHRVTEGCGKTLWWQSKGQP